MDTPRFRALTGAWRAWLAVPVAALAAQDPAAREHLPPHVDQLCARAEVLALDDPEAASAFRSLLTEAQRLVASKADEHGLRLMEHLAQFVVTRREAGRRVADDAGRLASLYAEADAHRPRARWRQVDFRMWGECSLYSNEPAQAWTAFQRGLHVVPPDGPFEVACLNLRAGAIDLQLGRLEAAARALDAAQAAATEWTGLKAENRSTGGPLQRAIALLHADLCLLGDDADGAAKALEPVQALGDTKTYLQLCALLRGDPAVAAQLRATGRDEKTSPELRALLLGKLVQHALAVDDLDAAADDMAALQTLSPVERGGQDCRTATLALEIALRSGTAFDGDLATRVDAAWKRALDFWRRAPQIPGGIGLLHIGDRASFVANVIRAQAAPGDDAALTAAFRRVVEAHAAGVPRVPMRDPDAIRKDLLREQHGLLVFVPGRFGTALLAVDRDRVSAHTLPPAKALRRHADSLRRAAGDVLDRASDPDEAEAWLEAAAADAAKAVLPDDVRARIAAWHRVSIVGASMLQNLPFELLPIDTSEGTKRLGETLAIDYVANLVAAAAAAARLEPTKDKVVIAGSILAATRNERRSVPPGTVRLGEPYTSRPDVLLDGDATVDAVVGAFPRAAVVHCFGHGELDPDSDAHAIRLADGPDGLLTARRVASTTLRGAVVILGSCRAGNAPLRRGGDPLATSVAGAMLATEARCVLAPTTDVRLGHHLAAAAILHRELAENALPADALLVARRETAATGDLEATLELLLTQLHGRGF